MKTKLCYNCNKIQQVGKFCVSCGGQLFEKVVVGVKFKKMQSSRSFETLKKDLTYWLNRVGVQNSDVQIVTTDNGVSVTYFLNGQKYVFKSHNQEKSKDNLACIELLIHSRVLGIERGIESADQAFAGYSALPDYSGNSDYFVNCKTVWEVDDLFKTLVKKFHPDTGGSVESFKKLQMQREKKIEEFEN